MFTLQHQDGDILYEFKDGGFSIENSQLSFSIYAEVVDEESFPDSFQFALNSYPIEDKFERVNINIIGDVEDTLPNIFAYSTFHSYETKANIDILKIDNNSIEVTFQVTSDDVEYYNEQAKPNDFIGTIKLIKKKKSEHWMPV